MGIFSSLLLPLLKTGAVVGASAIPGIGAVAGPVTAGLLSAGQGMMQGQGPLSSLAGGAINAGMSAGFNQLGDWMNNADAGQADTSAFQHQYSMVDPSMANDPLTDWAVKDLQQNLQQRLLQRNSFMIGGGGF